MSRKAFACAAVLVAVLASAAAASPPPVAVSPGTPERLARAGDRCPTFSWGAVPDAAAFHLAVYDATDGAAEPQLVVSQELPGSVSSWTPSLERCLLPGRTYAWRVGAEDRHGAVSWSEPVWFDVAEPLAEVPSAWVEQVVERLSLAPAGDQARVPGAARGPRVPLPSRAPARAGMLAPVFSVGNAGVVTAGAVQAGPVTAESFTGDGAGVTNVDAATLNGSPVSDLARAVHDHDTRYFTRHELEVGGAGGAVHWGNLTSVPAGFADNVDNDTDTTCNGQPCNGTYFTNLGWANLVSVPAGFADNTDNDTTYAAGAGLALTGTTFSVPGAETTPAGNTLTTIDSTGGVGTYASVTIGADGLGLISYYDGTNGDLKVAHCSNVACTSATITTLDSGGNVGHYTSVALGADGLGLISYQDVTNVDLKVAHCENVACTSATLTTLDSTGLVGSHTSVAVGSDGLGVISYYDATNTGLKVAHCQNAACTSADLNSVFSSLSGCGRYASIAIGTNGLPWISFYDSTYTRLYLVSCADLACASGYTLTPMDDSADVGTFTSIAVGADGLPLISYHDASNAQLKLAHCDDPWCTTHSAHDLGGSHDFGSYTSITVGADGLGIISYYDEFHYDLKVAHCIDIACSAATTTALDTAGDVGEYTSVTIGADGLPLIVYHDYTNDDLKVAHCANVFCTPYFRRR